MASRLCIVQSKVGSSVHYVCKNYSVRTSQYNMINVEAKTLPICFHHMVCCLCY